MTKSAGERRSGVANYNRMGVRVRNTCGRPIRGVVPIIRSVSGPSKSLAVGIGDKAQANYEKENTADNIEVGVTNKTKIISVFDKSKTYYRILKRD